MHVEKLFFAQLMEWVPHYEFHLSVERYDGDYRVRSCSCWDQFLCMPLAQVTYRESLRDVEACLRARFHLLYHLGIRGHVARSTLADANEQRNWRLYADLAQKLIRRARRLYAQEPFGVELDQTVYALDSTTIERCLNLLPWARFRQRKEGIKLHTLLDLHGSIPSFIRLTDAACHDVNALDALPLEPVAFYLMDRGYVDFARLYRFTQARAFFVTRAKQGLRSWRHRSWPVPPKQGVRADQWIRLSGVRTAEAYPALLRRVTTCRGLARLDELGIQFITLRRRSPRCSKRSSSCLVRPGARSSWTSRPASTGRRTTTTSPWSCPDANCARCSSRTSARGAEHPAHQPAP